MIEKKFIQIKKEEFKIKEFIKEKLGKGKISDVKIERTPIGEKIMIHTTRPGIVIGRKGSNLQIITEVLKRKFRLSNPHIEIVEIEVPELDAQTVADQIALSLERFGPLSFKITAYKMLQRVMRAGALGVEIILSGKLPSERARTWRFAQGYLIKVGEGRKLVGKAQAVANTRPGTVGVNVSILRPDIKIPDKIDIEKKEQEVKKEDGNIEKKGN